MQESAKISVIAIADAITMGQQKAISKKTPSFPDSLPVLKTCTINNFIKYRAISLENNPVVPGYQYHGRLKK